MQNSDQGEQECRECLICQITASVLGHRGQMLRRRLTEVFSCLFTPAPSMKTSTCHKVPMPPYKKAQHPSVHSR